MRYRDLCAAVAVLGGALGLIATTRPAAAACQIQQFAELQVDPGTGAPQIKAQINGQPAMLMANTGTNVTFLSRTAAVKLGLKPKSLLHVDAYSSKGELPIQDVTVADFQIGNLHMKDYGIFVIDDKFLGDKIAGEIGGSIIFTNDVEFDLPDHVIRLVKPIGCKGDQVVFWNKAYSMVPLTGFDDEVKQFYTTVFIDGRRIEALVDTGSEASVLNYRAAVSLGLKPVPKPAEMHKAADTGTSPNFIGKIDSFALGDEVIRNTMIQIKEDSHPIAPNETGTRLGAETYASNMVLGADFFRAHRVLIAKSQNMLYFSYMGGPVFDLTASTKAEASPPGGTTTPRTPASH